MKLYTREKGALRAVAFDDDSTLEKALDLINVKHLAVRELKSVGVHPDKKAPILLCIEGTGKNFTLPDSPSVA
ncbi:hypothetical protein AVV44_gp005 [Cronobacter phage S13]|jgi:hypothetical protein|uniref:Uncharacterized protein n=1 Tax=Cronobacter phage LPCS28 TaxID=2924885 RepID=A0AAE9K6J9_9CAUD|nr:hypothetical protein AVV44_gp005 [Cronobacter phage S13]YP_010665856.1 hypothetical protein PQB73_gp168 [Cronobacter phage LPCS28]AIA64804.1 hypothetical protein S13_005 [Cronobacter phage S13]UNY47045.1 hypothetical protein EHEKIMEA_00163 [Cronobacter phage LPCS28]